MPNIYPGLCNNEVALRMLEATKVLADAAVASPSLVEGPIAETIGILRLNDVRTDPGEVFRLKNPEDGLSMEYFQDHGIQGMRWADLSSEDYRHYPSIVTEPGSSLVTEFSGNRVGVHGDDIKRLYLYDRVYGVRARYTGRAVLSIEQADPVPVGHGWLRLGVRRGANTGKD